MLLAIVSPTWMLAAQLKGQKYGRDRERVIERLNRIYLTIAVGGVCGIGALAQCNFAVPLLVKLIYGYFLFSRCTEVFYAFLKDAIDHLNRAERQSSLTYGTRLSLALRSYLELILDFALIYTLCPRTYWKGDPSGIIDFVYFSGVTITTTGFGDISPVHWLPKLMSIYEIFCGVTLLVVCFTIYTSRALEK